MTDIDTRTGTAALRLTLDDAESLRPIAVQIIRVTGGWTAPSDQDEADRAALNHELDLINKELQRAGFAYPLGHQGVHDLANAWLLRNEP